MTHQRMNKVLILSVFLTLLFAGCSDDREVQGNNPNVIPAVENVDLQNPVIPVNAETAAEICASGGTTVLEDADIASDQSKTEEAKPDGGHVAS